MNKKGKRIISTASITFLVCMLFSIFGQFLPATVIKQNVMRSKVSFSEKALYSKVIENYDSSQLDDFTDAIILATAGYIGNESAIEKAFANYRAVSGDPCESLQTYGLENIDMQKSNYARYWLGCVFFTKVLLLLFDYSGIQMFNHIMQTLLLLFLVILMERKRLTRYIVPLVVTLLWIMPGIVYLSIQFSTVYYLILVSMILVLIFDGFEKDENLNAFLCALGGGGGYKLVGFFDISTCSLRYASFDGHDSKK